MEIEFSVRITPEEKRQQLYASIGFTLVSILSVILVKLLLDPVPWIPFVPVLLLGANRHFAPYLKMRRQATTPDRLRIENHLLIYIAKGKETLSLPLSSISRIENKQGLALYLKTKQIRVLDPVFSLSKFLKKASKQKCDLYFEWFEPKVSDLLKSRLNDVVHPN